MSGLNITQVIGRNVPLNRDIERYTFKGAAGYYVYSVDYDVAVRLGNDLLKALEGMMKCFDDGVGTDWNSSELDAARAVIAKARGES